MTVNSAPVFVQLVLGLNQCKNVEKLNCGLIQRLNFQLGLEKSDLSLFTALIKQAIENQSISNNSY